MAPWGALSVDLHHYTERKLRLLSVINLQLQFAWLIGLSFFERPILDHDAKAHTTDFMKFGGFHVKSTQNLIKSDVSTKTLQFGGCREGAMTQDFMKSWVIAPLLHSSN